MGCEPSGWTLARETRDGLRVGVWVDVLRRGLDRLLYDVGARGGNVRSGEGEWTIPTAHCHWGWAPWRADSWSHVWPGTGGVVLWIGALGHCAHWGCTTGSGGRGGDVDCADTVFERADVNDGGMGGR